VPLTGTRCGCATCGEVFSCVRSFDVHRAGHISQRYCLNPAEVRRADGRMMFEQVDYEVVSFYWRERDGRDSTATDRLATAYPKAPRGRGRRSTATASKV
jgi:hypothetical protein